MRGKWQELHHELTDRQQAVMIGSMLGDGCLTKTGNRNNSLFCENHGIKQYDWLRWKESQLEPLSNKTKTGKTVARKNLGGGIIVSDKTRSYHNCKLTTIRHPVLTIMEKQWYKRDGAGNYIYKTVGTQARRIKVVPPDLKLTTLALAVWYMDDGSNDQSGRSCCIYSLDFSEEEVDRLVELIRSLGFLECWKSRYNSSQRFYITIGVDSYLGFIKTIADEIVSLPESMRYKVDLSEYTTPWHKSPEYHPLSKLNDALVSKIMEDAKHKISQREIGMKYGIPYRTINKLLRGKTLYKSEFAGALNYRNKTGTKGVSCYGDTYQVSISIRPNGKPLHLCLGRYTSKIIAAKVSAEAQQLRDAGIVDADLYRQIKKKYKGVLATAEEKEMVEA